MKKFDYIITKGRVISPSSGLDSSFDIGICEGKIVCIGKDLIHNDLRTSPATHIIEARGKIVTPGLIDMHCHFYPEDYYSLMPDDAGYRSGCSCIVDGGSAGMLTYDYFESHYMTSCKSKTYALLLHHPIGQFFQEENWKNVSVNAEATADFIRRHSRIVGLKDKLTADFAWYQGVEGVRRAIDIAHKARKTYAVHLGTALKLVSSDDQATPDRIADRIRACTFELLNSLRPGDIIFHAFTGKVGGLFTSDSVYDEAVRSAVERGVLLDASVGRANFDITSYKTALQKGFLPHIISSDLVKFGLTDIVFNFGVALSKFVDNGLTLPEVINKSTFMPAQTLKLASVTGSLEENGPADITISDVESGTFTFHDKMNGQTFTGTKLIRPKMCFVDGVLYKTLHQGLPSIKE